MVLFTESSVTSEYTIQFLRFTILEINKFEKSAASREVEGWLLEAMRLSTTLKSCLILSSVLATKLCEFNSQMEVTKFKYTTIASLKAATRSPLPHCAFISWRLQARQCRLAAKRSGVSQLLGEWWRVVCETTKACLSRILESASLI